ncbi:MAG: hypothetical protein ACRDHZ_06520 [Ktedonobacteraceae bacterium]
MSLVLTGFVNGMRPVAGKVEDGPRKDEEWHFLSLEIVDSRYGKVYSCQLRDDDPQYKDFVDGTKLKQDWTGHKVKATIKGQIAGEREIEDKGTKAKRVVLQIRSQVTNLRDLGTPKDDDE